MYTKSYNVTTATRATEQYFPVVLFIMLYKVVLTFGLWMKTYLRPFKLKLLNIVFLWFILENKAVLSFEFIMSSQRKFSE